MKLKFKIDKIHNVLKQMKSVLMPNVANDILKTFGFEQDENGNLVLLGGNDLMIAKYTFTTDEYELSGDFQNIYLNTKILLNAVSKFSKAKKYKSFTIDAKKDDKVILTNGHNRLTVHSLALDCYIKFADLSDAKQETFTLNQSEQAKLNYVAKNFPANDNNRPQLMGINFEGHDNQIKISASDSHILFTANKTTDHQFKQDFNITPEALQLAKAFGMFNDSITMHVYHDFGYIVLNDDHLQVQITTIEAQYPDISHLLIKNADNKVHFDDYHELSNILDYCKLVTILDLNESPIVKLTFLPDKDDTQGKLDILSKDRNNNEYHEILNIDVPEHDETVKSLEINFNIDYLMKCLGTFDQEINLELIGSLRPIQLEGKCGDFEDVKVLVTPVRTY